ncbi:unnamed protein product [Parnassius apollo]|uniref:(apollo) hypothetical protein n=1 Tax=Parnassius apollo TaxID=110799 RepID=A0A8S3XBP3_PARAO|nr:unnamed protein product [Parnassius apollo]
MDPLAVYNNKRICDNHFKTEHKTSGHRLIFTAVPSLYLNGVTKSPNISVQLEHNYCIPRMYKNVHVADIPTEKLPSHLVDYKKVSSNLNIPLITEKFQLNQPSTSKMYKDEAMNKKSLQYVMKKHKHLNKQVRKLKNQIKHFKIMKKDYKTRLANAEKTFAKSAFQKITKDMTLPGKIFTSMQ